MRTKKSIKNIVYSFTGQFIVLGLSLLNRFIFIKFLGLELLGISSIFANILSLLSVVELGIGVAIVYKLYKPLADKDYKKIAAYLKYYQKLYRYIGIIIIILGLIVTPFIDRILGNYNSSIDTYIYFILYLLNTAVTYFYSYKKSILIADQNSYIVTIAHNLSLMAVSLFQIVALIYTGSFTLYLIVGLFFKLIENISISYYTDKRYPYIKEYRESVLLKSEKDEFSTEIRALALHKIGSIVVNGTDNIVISVILGITSVGLYSNYMLILNTLSSFLSNIFGSLTASVGNLNVTSTKEKSYEVFKKILLINFWTYGFSSISFFLLAKDFIRLWLGEFYVVDFTITGVLALNFYVNGIRKSILLYKEAYGFYTQDKYKPLVQSLINLVISIILAHKIGLAGVILGTLISSLFVCFWWEGAIVYKLGFDKKLKEYIMLSMKYTFQVTIISIILMLIISKINYAPVINLLMYSIIIVIVFNVLFIIFNKNSDEYKYFKALLLGFITKEKIRP